MTKRYTGGVVSSSLPTVNAAGASGVFLLSQQADYQAKNNWPPFKVEKSLRFRAANSAYLSKTPAAASNRTTWTWSGWVKRGNVSDSATLTLFSAGTFNTDDTVFRFDGNVIDFFNRNSSTINGRITTTAVYRDPAAWYHIVIVWDTTQATSSNRIKLYVNGTQVTDLQTATYPSQNQTSNINNTVGHYLGVNAGATSQYFDGYQTDVNFIDGQQLTPSHLVPQTKMVTGLLLLTQAHTDKTVSISTSKMLHQQPH